MPGWRTERARIAALKRHHGPDTDVSTVTRDLRVAQAEDTIRRLFEFRPPPTAEQCARLVALVQDGGNAA
jgi:hypothetical protein